VPAGDVITAVLFGFAALWWVLGVLLPRRGSEHARIWVIAQETFIAFLGLAIFGTWAFALDGYYLIAPVGLFIAAGIFMSACAVAGLLSGSARDYCNQRAAL
jgi:fatty acid desaturase